MDCLPLTASVSWCSISNGFGKTLPPSILSRTSSDQFWRSFKHLNSCYGQFHTRTGNYQETRLLLIMVAVSQHEGKMYCTIETINGYKITWHECYSELTKRGKLKSTMTQCDIFTALYDFWVVTVPRAAWSSASAVLRYSPDPVRLLLLGGTETMGPSSCRHEYVNDKLLIVELMPLRIKRSELGYEPVRDLTCWN